MADGVYVVADSLEELLTSFKEVLDRARKAGLTFRPKKIVIAPSNTTLFGWQKTNDGWLPNDLTTSPLSRANEPSTVKQLHLFIGSYKQLSECISYYAILLHPIEKAVPDLPSAHKIEWSQTLCDYF